MTRLRFTSLLTIGTLAASLLFTGCGPRKSQVDIATENQILLYGNKAEPQGLDPHSVEGVGEHQILSSLLEGLVAEDPKTLMPVPGQAEKWEISPDGKVYTFHLRKNAVWSNGDPVTAQDFIDSYIRLLTPSLGSRYSMMLYPIKGAREFNEGKTKDANTVGLRAIDAKTFEITLNCKTPYLLNVMANHYTWWPVHMPTIRKSGDPYRPGSKWTQAGNFVGNGPFMLTEWRPNTVIRVRKSPSYWDAAIVRLNGIDFLPIESVATEENAFRSGQMHRTEELPPAKIDSYRRENPNLLRIDPYLATYFYRFNTTLPQLKDKRVRQALTMAIDRKAIVETLTRGNQPPAFAFTPPNTLGYTSRAQVKFDIEAAKKLLAEAGYPDGKGLSLEIHYNTSENHRAIAEAVQQMWKKNLGVEPTLRNEEWKVYMATQNATNYVVSRAGWTGDYPDPNTFHSTFLSYDGNNRTGWKNAEYDRLVEEAACMVDEKARYENFQKAEAILLDELPLLPIYYYTRVYLLHPSVKNWHPTFLDHHPFKHVYLEAPAK